MQFVTYENLFSLTLVIIGIIGLVADIVLSHKKKEPPGDQNTGGLFLLQL